MGGHMTLEIFGDGTIKRNGANSVFIGVGPFIANPTEVLYNYTVPANTNAMSTGPVTIANGVTVTVSDGSRWVIT